MKVVKIGAVWCSSCLVMRPRWEQLEKKFPWLKTEYYDFDQNKEAIKKYNLQEGQLPVFIFISKKDQEILRLNGEYSLKKLEEIVLKNKDK